jgi:hypothetical protein
MSVPRALISEQARLVILDTGTSFTTVEVNGVLVYASMTTDSVEG